MKSVVPRSVRAQLVTWFVLLAALPFALAGLFSFYKARTSLQEAEFRNMQLLWDAKRQELISWFRETADNLVFLSKTVAVRAVVQVLAQKDADPDIVKYDADSLSALLGPYMAVNPVEEGLEDFVVIGGESGTVVFTQKKLADKGADLKSAKLKNTCLGRVWEEVMKTGKPFVSDFSMYPPIGQVCAAIGVPVSQLHGKEVKGVLALRINANKINDILSMGEAPEKTTEAYVVGKDLLMRCQSRFEKETTLLKKKIDTTPVKLGFEGKGGRSFSKDYRGRRCISYAGLVGINKQKAFAADFDWVLVSEVDEAEAFSSVLSLEYWSVGATLVVAFVVIVTGFLLARRITRPVTRMAAVATEVSTGNLNVEIPELKRQDEIGALSDSFRLMTRNLKSQITRLIEGVAILSAVAAEISSAVAQVSSSIAQTSTAVAETSSTVAELRQAARLASQKSRSVADAAQRAVGVSELGKKATEEAITRINLINDQMQSVGDSVIRLSDHSQAIENIIATVQDLADQSNLLAVNASIEAARAGDQGKGFAVVAHEIKSLADQSREATEQVRTILEDTRKWVNSVVMATEQGANAVHTGVEQSVKTGEALGTLAQSVLESSQAADLIQATSEQQVAGVDQVSLAMGSIEQAVKQMHGGTDQLRQAATRLEDLGKNIKELVDQYRV